MNHIAVVGAGAFGGWTALELLRRGVHVTLIDAWGPGNSRASSGGETRVIRGIYGDNPKAIERVARAFPLWEEHCRQTGEALFHRTGSLWMFGADDSYARLAQPHLRKVGLAAQKLDLAEARARYPQINFEGVAQVYHDDYSGYLMARQACRSVWRCFTQEGGTWLPAMVSPGPIRSGNMEFLLLDDGSTLEADAYIFACGPWLRRLFPRILGHRLQVSRQIVCMFGLPAGRNDFEDLPVWTDFTDGLRYGIPNGDYRGFKIADDTHGPDFDPAAEDRLVEKEEVTALRQWMAKRFPQLVAPPLVESRVCQYTYTEDGEFLMEQHGDAQNVWLAGAGNGHGFKMGPVIGKELADLVLGTQHATDGL